MRIGIVAHHKRKAVAEDLAIRVAADVIELDVTTPTGPRNGAYRCTLNHLDCLEALLGCVESAQEWVVVLEDDAMPVADFRFHVERAVTHAPSELVGLYIGTGNPSGEVQRQIRAALEHAGAWLAGDFFISAVGYAVKAHVVNDLIECTDIHQWPLTMEWPMRVTKWAQKRGYDVSYTHPSLVDHADTPSVILPGAKSGRRAWEVGTREDWDSPVTRIGYCPDWSPSNR